MKKVATLMLWMSSYFVCAGSSPEVSVVYAGNKTFALYLDQAQKETQLVKLKDKYGQVLLSDRARTTESFARRYNLMNLPAGEYFLTVEDGTRTFVQPITVTINALNIPENALKTVFTPSVVVSTARIDYTLLCLDETAVTIEIIDEFGRKNYTATTQEQGSVQRRFDIRSLTPGTYSVVTKLKDNQFEKRYTEVFTIGEIVASR